MACGSCGGRKKSEIAVWQVTYKDGTRRPEPFLTELEARAEVAKHGGSYTRVVKRKTSA